MTHPKIQLPVSVVIPCFNRPRGLRNLLSSFRESAFTCEIILIDDCSRDSISDIVDVFDDLNIVYKRNPVNLGPAISRNLGIATARHEFIAFTDDDCRVTKDWLIELYDGLLKADPNVAGIGGRVVAGDDDVISRYYEYHKILDPWYFKGRFYYIVTANCLFRRDPLLAVECFDERLSAPGGEDPGLCFKLLKRGYRFLYSPDAVIVHDFNRSVFAFVKTFFRYGFGCSVQSMRYFENQDTPTTMTFGALENSETDGT